MGAITRRTSVALFSGATAGALLTGNGRAEAKSAHLDRLIGTWALTVEFDDGLQNPTLISFDTAGAVVETNALTRSTGLGTWSRSSSSRFSYVFWEQIFDAADQLQSHVRVSHDLKVAHDGTTYEGEGIGDIFDLSWQPVASVHTKFTARRLT